MSEISELNDINREDEQREDIKREADREYDKPFEGVVDVNKVMAERDELDELLKKALAMIAELEKELLLKL